MNKQELIKRFQEMEYVSIHQMGKKAFIDLIKQLDEPQKQVVPQFVADWYEEYNFDLEFNIWDWIKYTQEEEKIQNRQFTEWLGESENDPVETLVKMKLFGYEVEKEKRYSVKLKAVDQYLVSAKDENFLGFLQSRLRSKFTRKELENLGFDWVFDCPGIEIEEVE